MRRQELDYELPAELIAQRPLDERTASRMMVLFPAEERWEHRMFPDLPALLQPGDLLVLNDARVIPARLLARKEPSGGRVELTLLRRRRPGLWEAMVSGRRAPPGTRLRLQGWDSEEAGPPVEILAELPQGHRLLALPDEAVERWGRLPMPPYIREQIADPARYQTVYARRPGAVAAPTAGLHFDGPMLERLQARGVELAWVTLHVGPGTFRPLSAERVEEHRMEPERCRVPPETVSRAGRARRVVAVGTTTVRALEKAASGGRLEPFRGQADLFITPGHRFRVVGALLTNFHLPRSTPLALVAAFCQQAGPAEGRTASAGLRFLLRAYREAIERGYRFYSFGDCMLLL